MRTRSFSVLLSTRVATNGPTLRPLWYLYESHSFYWLTDTANVLHRKVVAGEPIVLVVDVCDLRRERSFTSGREERPQLSLLTVSER